MFYKSGFKMEHVNLLVLLLCCGCHSTVWLSPGFYTCVFMLAVIWRRRGMITGHFHIIIKTNTWICRVEKISF